MNKKQLRLLLFGFLGVVVAGGLVYALTQTGTPAVGQAPAPGSVQGSGQTLTPGAGETVITLRDGGSTASGSGAIISGDKVTIRQGGTYLISGSLSQGQIYVEAGGSDTVLLRLAGAEIKNAAEAAIHVENAGLTIIEAVEGTRNLLQSGEAPAEGVLSAAANGTAGGGALYARDDLTLTGGGTLRVLGYLNNGVHTTNDLVVEGGALTIEAVNNGLKGKDSVTVTGGSLSIRSGGDGVKSDDTAGPETGWIAISGGEFTIESAGDGVQAETALTITGGSFDLRAGEGSANVTHSEESGWGRPDSNWDLEEMSETSTKGLKSGGDMTITGGAFTVDSRDDTIHAGGSIEISGGSFSLSGGDDGIHADFSLTIKEGVVNVLTSYEGLEANQLFIQGGTVNVTSTDDGLNAYGGQNNMGGGWGGGTHKTTEEKPVLRITGGTLTVDAKGDGLDSNGDLLVEGGLIIVNGPAGSGNGALDHGAENGGQCSVSGGTILALGASGMAEGFGQESTQYSFRYGFESSFAAGEELTITDSKGEVLFRHTLVKSGNSVVFSAPELADGETYTLRVGGQTAEITLSGISTTAGTGGRGFGSGGMGGLGGLGGGRPGRFDGNDRQPPSGEFPGEPPEGRPGEFSGDPPQGGRPGRFGDMTPGGGTAPGGQS